MNYATIKEVFADGVTLMFDDGSASTQRYKCNAAQVFKAGDRARVTQSGNSFFVESVVGSPATATTVADLAANATLATAVAKINELLAALRVRDVIS